VSRTRGLLGTGLFLLLGAVALQSCVYVEGQTERYQPPRSAEPVAATGRELYLRDCAWCHGDEGEGTSQAPDLVSGTNGPAFTHFMLTTGRMPIDFSTEVIERREPEYEPEEVDAIVDFVQTFGADGPAIPEPEIELADTGLGAELYQENCAACHSTTAIGGALTQGRVGAVTGAVARKSELVAPGLEPSTPVEIAEAMRVGPGTMPVFGEVAFTDDQVDAIVRYVVYLQNPDDRGGLAIGRIGPVAEGAVGWIVGLGAMVVLVRWIGTKTGER
jgi:ubiquinol-cytochrome c reductase cytochrome c subunit